VSASHQSPSLEKVVRPFHLPSTSLIRSKVLTRVRRSPAHPSLTLDCSDGTSFQLLIDGYNPAHPGVPKFLEMDPSLDLIFNPPSGHLLLDLTIVDCVAITLMDKAHDTRVELQGPRDEQWDQHHIGVAFKFLQDIAEGHGGKGWHCVWATLAEYDEERGESHSACVFRSYNDVYLDTLQRSPSRSPKKRSPRKRNEYGHRN
jgi:hypothetical protein